MDGIFFIVDDAQAWELGARVVDGDEPWVVHTVTSIVHQPDGDGSAIVCCGCEMVNEPKKREPGR